jgi:AraC-like DNA-binding protein
MADVDRARTQDQKIVRALQSSATFQKFEEAFSEAFGLPIAIETGSVEQLSLHGKNNESPFCQLMTRDEHALTACLAHQKKVMDTCQHAPMTIACPHGLRDTAVPISLGERVIAYLRTGHALPRKPSKKQIEGVIRQIGEWNVDIDVDLVRETYMDTKVIPEQQYEAVTSLMRVFADYLSSLSNQLALREETVDPRVVTMTKEYIEQCADQPLSLSTVAKAVGASKYHLSRIFKDATGLSFTEYVVRVRVERAKSLLHNLQLNISQVAYASGFQSITHFNRVFRRIVGVSPRVFRDGAVDPLAEP